MDAKSYALRMFSFDNWANQRILKALEALPELDPASPPATLFSHVLTAEEVWLARLIGRPYRGHTFWPELDPASWPQRLAAINEQWLTFLDAASTDLDTYYTYYNSKGGTFETSLRDIVTHLIIHGQHHRAQIALHLRAMGQEPPPTDFIYFTRSDAAS